MKLGIVGTGHVATTLASAWAKAGHEIIFGSRHPTSGTDLGLRVAPLYEAVRAADVVVNATPGAASLETLSRIGAEAFGTKILIDVANANTASFELVYPNSSLGERLQNALPDARVVKTMNTAAMTVMTNPGSIAASSVFLSGDDADAKATVAGLLADFGWPADAIVDLGGIQTSRATEHYFPLFAALMQLQGNPNFNIKLVR